jgi:hypothetical protein
MTNITEIEIEGFNGQMQTHVVIDRGNGEFTSMLKSTYDKQKAEQSTPMIPGDE